MSIKNFIKEKFNVEVVPDDEGVYTYFVSTKEENSSLKAYDKNDNLCSSILMECDDNNYLAIKYFNELGNPIFVIDGTKISAMDFIDDEYEDINDGLIIEKAFIFYSETWSKRYLRIDFYPNAAISLEVDYEKYSTDEDGVIIWE